MRATECSETKILMSLLSLIIFGAVSVYSFHVLAFLIASGCVNMIIQVYRAKFSCEMDNIFFLHFIILLA